MNYQSLIYGCMALVLTSCGANNAKTAEEKQELSDGEMTVTLTDRQARSLGITTGSAADHAFVAVVEANGQMATDPQSVASVTPLMGANVQKVLVKVGQTVAKGQVVAYLSHPDFIDLQSRYLTAVNRQSYLNKEFRRQTEMMTERVGAGKDYDRIRSEVQINGSEMAMLASQLRQMGIRPAAVRQGKTVTSIALRSPIAGSVEQIQVETGQYTSPEQPVMRIVNTQNVFADLQVFQRDIAKVKAGQHVSLQMQSAGGQECSGVVYAVGKAFEPETQSVHVRVRLQDAGTGVIAGMYVQAKIAVGRTVLTAVPEDAVVDDDGVSYIFSAQRNGNRWRFVPIAVEKLRAEGGMVAVRSREKSLNGVSLALSGAYYLLSDMRKGETGEE